VFGGWSQGSLFNDLRTTTPANHINRLIQYVYGILYTLTVGYVAKTAVELNTINTTLATDPLPPIVVNRNEFIDGLVAITGFWVSRPTHSLKWLTCNYTNGSHRQTRRVCKMVYYQP